MTPISACSDMVVVLCLQPPLPPPRILNISGRGVAQTRGFTTQTSKDQCHQFQLNLMRCRAPLSTAPLHKKNPQYFWNGNSTNKRVCDTIQHQRMTSVSSPPVRVGAGDMRLPKCLLERPYDHSNVPVSFFSLNF